MLALLLALTLLPTHMETPQDAAARAVRPDPGTPIVVLRVNVFDRYAAVLTGGGTMEGEAVTAPILLELFSFGWQPIEVLNVRCALDAHDLGARAEATLMAQMPPPTDDRPCRGALLKDAGPVRDVEAVRALMRGPLVPAVVVSGRWALGKWYGAGGGESLFHEVAGRWHRVAQGGGAMGVHEMRAYGVPSTAWCAFGIGEKSCR